MSTIFARSRPSPENTTYLTMRNEVLACIHELAKEFSDTPFNAKIIAESCKQKQSDVERVFDSLVKDGIIKRKFTFLKFTYSLTEKGQQEIAKLQS